MTFYLILIRKMKIIRLLFSKIIDCLQSGSCMMAIGPENISSIEYCKKIDGVIIITDINEIYNNLYKIVNNFESLIDNAKKTYDFAKKIMI